MKAPVRQSEAGVDPVLLNDLIPAVDAALAVRDVVVAQALVQRRQRGLVRASRCAAAVDLGDRVRRLDEAMIVALLPSSNRPFSPAV